MVDCTRPINEFLWLEKVVEIAEDSEERKT
jgi:hypothetical protein